ncbi:MAG: hypothetical protein HOV83_24675 [Catenulispora sp.]|nr:hypothetical protein [Catenulispora sp.]
MTNHVRRHRWAGMFLAPMMAVSACGSSKSAAPPKVEMNVPSSVTPTQLSGDVPVPTLPIQAYKPTNSDQHEINLARLTAMRSCMTRLGFDYPPLSSFPKDTSGTALPADAYRYGPLSMTEAADGYKFAVIQDARNTAGQPTKPATSPAESAALAGDAKNPGCAQQAIAAISVNGGTLSTSDLVSNIDQESFQKSQSSPQLIAAFKAWSTCMSGKGFSYATPLDPLSSSSSFAGSSTPANGVPTPSTDEVATAKADVDCKSSTGVVGVWVAIETQMQKQAIEKNSEALKQVKDAEAATVRNAAKILGR